MKEHGKEHGIGWAVRSLRNQKQLCRAAWNGKGQYLELHDSENGMMTLPYICISTVSGQLVPWTASQTDLLARDWEIFEDLPLCRD